jgi:hypothetical protein
VGRGRKAGGGGGGGETKGIGGRQRAAAWPVCLPRVLPGPIQPFAGLPGYIGPKGLGPCYDYPLLGQLFGFEFYKRRNERSGLIFAEKKKEFSTNSSVHPKAIVFFSEAIVKFQNAELDLC